MNARRAAAAVVVLLVAIASRVVLRPSGETAFRAALEPRGDFAPLPPPRVNDSLAWHKEPGRRPATFSVRGIPFPTARAG